MAWNEHIDVYNSSLCCQLVTDPKSTIWVHILNQSLQNGCKARLWHHEICSTDKKILHMHDFQKPKPKIFGSQSITIYSY